MLASIAGKWQKYSGKETPMYIPGDDHNAEGTQLKPVSAKT